MGTAAVAYIALLASRLPWFLGGAAPAAAGAGLIYLQYMIVNILILRSIESFKVETWTKLWCFSQILRLQPTFHRGLHSSHSSSCACSCSPRWWHPSSTWPSPPWLFSSRPGDVAPEQPVLSANTGEQIKDLDTRSYLITFFNHRFSCTVSATPQWG